MKIMSLIRVLFRAPIAFVMTLLIHHFLVRIPQLFHPGKRYTKPIALWGRCLAWVMGVRVHPQNELPLPMGDVVVANHMGFLDVPILLSFFPSVFMIKMELRRVFYFGRALEKQGHVFVQRGEAASRRSARDGLIRVLEDGDRMIVFPEGRSSPGSERLPFKPFTFVAAKQLNKTVQGCIIDYLPNRKMLEWDINKPTFGQLVNLFGRHRTDVSIEFLPAETIEDPEETATRYHDLIQAKLEENDSR